VASNCLRSEYQQDLDRLLAAENRPVCCV